MEGAWRMEVVSIHSVQPGNHYLMDQKEEDWIHRLRTMEYKDQGGVNIRGANFARNTNYLSSHPACFWVVEMVIMFTLWFSMSSVLDKNANISKHCIYIAKFCLELK